MSLHIKHKEMPLLAHLEEMRWVLIRGFCAVIICAVPCGVFWRHIFEFAAVWPLRLSDPIPELIFTAPTDAVLFIFKIALTCGTVLASPFLLLQIWRFIASALYKNEKAAIIPIVAASTFCFLSGIAFCYFFSPLFLKFLTGLTGGLITPLFRANEYFGFLIRMCLIFGLVFEMPVVSFVLSRMGIINFRLMSRYFRHVIVIIFIASAILTPPDIMSLILMSLPLILFYGISIFVSYLIGRKADYLSTNTISGLVETE